MKKTLDVTNPATNELIETLDLFDGPAIQKMLDAGKAAQKNWEKLSMLERGKILYKFCDLVESHQDELGALMAKEMGKPVGEGTYECPFAADLGRGYIERAKHLYGEVLTSTTEGCEEDVVFTKRVGLGIVAAIIPFNFPVEMSIAKTVAPMIMGNAVLVKAPSSNPLTVRRMVELAHEAGVPKDLVQFVVCERSVSNENIISNPKVACISLTGSTQAGIDLAITGAPTLKKVFLELGGNDPIIITEDADIDTAVEETIAGRLDNNGQVCCAIKRVIVQKNIKKEFVEKLVASLKEVTHGDAMDENARVTCLVTEDAAIKTENQINKTVEQGGKIVLGGKREGAYIPPTVIDDVPKTADVALDMEIFAPVYPVIAFDTEEEAIEISNSSMFALSAGIVSGDTIKGMRIANQLDTAGVVVNGGGCYRHVEQAWGGCKMSGLGYEGISTSLEEYSRIQTFAVKGAFSDL